MGVTGVVGTHKGCRRSGASVVLPRHVVEHLLVRGRSVSAFLRWASRRSSLEICSLWYLFNLLRTSAPVANLLPRAKTWWLSKASARPVFLQGRLWNISGFPSSSLFVLINPTSHPSYADGSLLSRDIDIDSLPAAADWACFNFIYETLGPRMSFIN